MMASSLYPGHPHAWTATTQALVDGLYVGIFVAFPCALVVLLLTTKNVFVSTYACFTVLGIVTTVLSFASAVVGF